MALPGKLERMIQKIAVQTDVEERLLSTLIRRLERNLVTLHDLFGEDCGEGCYEHLIKALFKEQQKASLDQYEEWVERCVTTKLGRVLTEAEETLLGEVVDQITGVTEALFTLAGVALAEEEEEEEPEEAELPD